MTIEEFEERTVYKLEVRNGKPYYYGSLYLANSDITELPDNLTVRGSIDLKNSAITELCNNLTVGKSLILKNSRITQLPENLTVGDNLNLSYTGITHLPDSLTVGGRLVLSGTNIAKLPDNLTVGDSLSIQNTEVSQLPRNLTVGWCLILNDMVDISKLPNDLTVGDRIYLDGNNITDICKVNHKAPERFVWRNGKYIKADDIFSKVISHKGNVYKICWIGEEKERYLVTNGTGKWAHGDTLQEAKNDLIYKISNRDKSAYKHLNLESELTFEEAIEAYRVITGACSAGTKMFVENNIKKRKDKYTIADIIRITRGQYKNYEFACFFDK